MAPMNERTIRIGIPPREIILPAISLISDYSALPLDHSVKRERWQLVPNIASETERSSPRTKVGRLLEEYDLGAAARAIASRRR